LKGCFQLIQWQDPMRRFIGRCFEIYAHWRSIGVYVFSRGTDEG
jgi:hypothetical protein